MESGTDQPSLRRWIALGLWSGLALALARGFILYGMDHLVRGHDVAATLQRIDARLLRILCVALGAGVIASLATSASRIAGFVVAGPLFLLVLSGFLWDDRYHVPDLGSVRGREAWAALAGGAAFAGMFYALLLRRAPRFLGGRPGLYSALACCVLVPICLRSFAAPSSTMTVRSIVADLTLDPDDWNVIAERADAPCTAGVLSPTYDSKVDGGDLPALIMPPPATLEITVPESNGELYLRAAAGIDRSILAAMKRNDPVLRFRFQVEVDGAAVFDERIVVDPRGDDAQRAWRRVGGAAPLAVQPGQRVRFKTECLNLERAADAFPVGFGSVALETRRERERTRSSPDMPNILLIVMDTLRADRTSVYGYDKPTTPNLVRLAERGLLFERAYSTSSWTWPSTASILTGLPVEAHGVKSATACHLALELHTLAEALQERGYTTAGFVGNPLIVANKNYDQGFEHYSATNPRDGFLFSEVIVPDLLGWLERNAGTRFFVYAHLVDPHEPYRPLPRFTQQFTGERPDDYPDHPLTHYAEQLLVQQGRDPSNMDLVPPDHARFMREEYDAAVATADYWVGRILSLISELGLSDETIIAFTSDHGEEFLDHGLLKHGQTLHPELVHIPLILAGPGIPAGERVSAAVSNRHLAPTLARFGGAAIENLDGAQDLVTGRAGGPVYHSTYSGWIGGRRDHTILGVRTDDWVLHATLRESTGADDPAQPPRVLGLYDVQRDPDEQNNVAQTEQGIAEKLMGDVLERAGRLTEDAPRAQGSGAETLELLRGVGYLGGDDED